MEKEPGAPDMLGINLQLRAIFGHSFPAYLGFRHAARN
jgi:glycerol-3-phosphate acyltransferase PlsY